MPVSVGTGEGLPTLSGALRLSSRQQTVGQGVGHGSSAAGHFEFGEDVFDMMLGGAPADEQGLTYVWVGGAVGEQAQYLELARA